MVYHIVFSNKVKMYFEKLYDIKLKEKFKIIIFDEIAVRPYYVGVKKKGKIESCYATGFKYKGCSYRIAYEINSDKLIIILLVGTHEMFYEESSRMY